MLTFVQGGQEVKILIDSCILCCGCQHTLEVVCSNLQGRNLSKPADSFGPASTHISACTVYVAPDGIS